MSQQTETNGVVVEEQSTAIAKRPPAPPVRVGSRGISITDLDGLQRFANMMVKSGYFQTAKDVAQACAKISYGLELGLSPIAALQGIYFFEGRLSLAAATIAALIKRHPDYDYRAKVSPEEATVTVLYRGDVIGETTFTVDMARTAGLMRKDNWSKYPQNMCFARALSNAARWFCPEVFHGAVYSSEEMQDGGFDVIDVAHDDSPAPAASSEDMNDALAAFAAGKAKENGEKVVEAPKPAPAKEAAPAEAKQPSPPAVAETEVVEPPKEEKAKRAKRAPSDVDEEKLREFFDGVPPREDDEPMHAYAKLLDDYFASNINGWTHEEKSLAEAFLKAAENLAAGRDEMKDVDDERYARARSIRDGASS